MFSVIRYNHATKAAPEILVTKTTLEDAKAFAEADIATARANVATKQYVTWTFINARTGEYIGAVADLPPAVEWGKGANG